MFARRALVLVLAILWLWPASLHAQSWALMEAYRQRAFGFRDIWNISSWNCQWAVVIAVKRPSFHSAVTLCN